MHYLFNTATYVVAYLLLLIPTYILPYFGSNSAVMGAMIAGVGLGIMPQWWIHLMLLYLLFVLALFRGRLIGKGWLWVLSFVAGVFDMTPGINLIPLVPTGLHLAAIIVGARQMPVIAGDGSNAAPQISRTSGVMALIGLGVMVLGLATSIATYSDAGKPNATVAAAPIAAPPTPAVPQLSKSAAPARPVAVNKPQASSAPEPKSTLAAQWLGTWKRQDGTTTLAISPSRIDISGMKRADDGKRSPFAYTLNWTDRSDDAAGQLDGVFGYSKKRTSPADIAKRYEEALRAYKKDPTDFSVSDPGPSRAAIATMAPGVYKIMWSYTGGDCGYDEYIIDGDKILDVSECKYRFQVEMLNRVP